MHVEGDIVPQLRQSGRLNQPRDFAPPPHDGLAFSVLADVSTGFRATLMRGCNGSVHTRQTRRELARLLPSIVQAAAVAGGERLMSSTSQTVGTAASPDELPMSVAWQ